MPIDLREPRFPEGPEMIAAMRRGVIEALCDHKSAGRSVITWDPEAGEIIEIPAGQIVIPEEIIEGERA